MDALWQYGAVFAAAAVPMLEVMVVVPAAIASGMSPVLVALLAFAGNAATVTLAVVGADRMSGWFASRRRRRAGAADVPAEVPAAERSERRRERARRVAHRWGLPGVAVLAPITIGTHVAAVTAVALRLPRMAVLSWTLAGLAGWTAVFAGVAAFGRSLF